MFGLGWIILEDILQACRVCERQTPDIVAQRKRLSFLSWVHDLLDIMTHFTMKIRVLKGIWN